MIPSTLGEFLDQLRDRKGLAVETVRDLLGVPHSTVYRWHSVDSRPTIESLQRLLELYDASPAEKLVAYELRARPATTHAADAA